jgi:Peptidase family M23
MPVSGRWLAYNSPGDRVPSHHLHAYGQTYAIDLVHDPAAAPPGAGLVAPGPAAGGLPRVRPGDRVAADEALAECGNSGNSSEPHLHFQLMDHPSVLLAAGLPLRFDRYRVGDADRAGVPHNLEPFTASR